MENNLNNLFSCENYYFSWKNAQINFNFTSLFSYLLGPIKDIKLIGVVFLFIMRN